MKTLAQFLSTLCLWHADLLRCDDAMETECHRCGNELYETRACIGCDEIYLLDEEDPDGILSEWWPPVCFDCAQGLAEAEFRSAEDASRENQPPKKEGKSRNVTTFAEGKS